MRQEPKLFSSGSSAPQQQDGFHVEPRRPQGPPRHDDDDERPSRRRGFPWRLLIGVIVLAVLGVVVWQAAGLLSGGGGDNAEGVPVFQATVDPFKHRPDDPGGLDVPNQNVTVYDTLDADESADGMEQLLPAPEEPMAIPEETVEVEDGVIDVANTPTAEVQQPDVAADPIFTADQVGDLVDQALTEAQGDIPIPQEKPAVPAAALAAANEPAAADPAADEGTAQTTGGGLSFSDVAAALDGGASQTTQPAQAEPEAPAQTDTAAAEPSAEEAPAAPAATGAGDYWVQIAAYSTREAASSAWERLAGSNADLLGSTSPRVMETSVAGTTLHRLQVGAFASQAQAQSLCDELQKRTGDQCMIVGP